MKQCPCGSRKAYTECCGKYLEGTEKPQTAEQLMRSRYTAHVVGNIDYIVNTVHPETRKNHDSSAIRDWALNTDWEKLELISREMGGIPHNSGTVEFKAHFKQGGKSVAHHELSTFRKHEGEWYFYDGRVDPKPVTAQSFNNVGRNDLCPCGSGKKYKKCCMNKN